MSSKKDRKNKSFNTSFRTKEKSNEIEEEESFLNEQDSYEFEISEKEQYENHAKILERIEEER